MKPYLIVLFGIEFACSLCVAGDRKQIGRSDVFIRPDPFITNNQSGNQGGKRSLAKKDSGGKLSQKELGELWTTLGGKDVFKAYKAIWTLVQAPGDSVRFLSDHLRPAIPAKKVRLNRLILELDSPRFTVRQKARRELEELGNQAVPTLQAAQKGHQSVEVRQEITRLLKRIDDYKLTPEQVRMSRALEVLERIGTFQARVVMRQLAAGAPRAFLTQEAQLALNRMDNPRK